MKCHYEVLDVPQDAEEAEIKTAYKKLALKWHPDKNLNNPDEAKEQFQFVQQAYEVLSDRQERAWYDNHREQILRGSNKDYEDNSLDVFQYFTTSCFKGYNDEENGFYTVYRKVFEDIAKEDLEYIKKEEFCEIPTFGNSTSDYVGVVGPFYNYWISYSTKKSYVWLDPYNINETRERRVIKLIEKENKKVRAKAKKERNEEIRNLVAFVRKRDKRVQAHAKKMEEKAKENKLKHEELSKQKRKERRKELHENSQQAEWAKFDNVESELAEIEKSLAQQFGEEFSNSEDEDFEEEIMDDLYCVACNKVFKTPKAFENHEASKKHRENIEKLKEEMLEDEDEEEETVDETEILDEGLVDDAILSDEVLSEEEIKEHVKSKKKGKNKKKVASVIESEDEVLQEVVLVEQEDDLDFNTKKSKKKDKKKKNKDTEHKTSELNEENCVNDDKNEEVEEVVKVKKGKKAKDKRKKGGDEEPSEPIDKDHSCVSCKANFDSKNKLFEHLKKTGHSVHLAKAPATITKTKKKSIK